MDKAAVSCDGLSEIELMHRAGVRVWQSICERWPQLSKITVFAGSGNNGGDAFVVAILARQSNLEVQFIARGDLAGQSETSEHYRHVWLNAGGEIEQWQDQSIEGELIVDGLLGIGLKRSLDESWQLLINRINRYAAPKVAIDIPSGLNARTGVPQPVAIQAEITVTFIGRKLGHVLADGPDYCGELIFDDLGISSTTLYSQTPALEEINQSNLHLPLKRRLNSHKNSYGHVLVIGGDDGMAGAASLAAQAALRSGAGMVSVLVHPECVHSLASIPELMVRSWNDIEDKLAQASVVVVGPGLGQSEAAKACLTRLTTTSLPMVVDASALTPDFLNSLCSQQVAITPHPGEAGILLSKSTKQVQTDRLAASEQLSELYAAISILKGSGTIIRQAGEIPAINLRGNPGMASAGMGDVLAGITGSLIGQGLTVYQAAKTAVYIHACCAERFAEQADETGLIASDIISLIPTLLKQLRHV